MCGEPGDGQQNQEWAGNQGMGGKPENRRETRGWGVNPRMGGKPVRGTKCLETEETNVDMRYIDLFSFPAFFLTC